MKLVSCLFNIPGGHREVDTSPAAAVAASLFSALSAPGRMVAALTAPGRDQAQG